MFDILKIFIEEPTKLWKLLFSFVKVVLATIFTSKLYIWLVGPFETIDLSNTKSLSNFILNGDILICIFLFLLSYFTLFELLIPLTLFPINWIAKKLSSDKSDLDEDDFVIFLLRIFKVIRFDSKRKRLYSNKSLKELIDFFISLQQKESQEEISKIKNTTIDNIVHTSIVFVLIFYFVINYQFSPALSRIIITIILLLIIIYVEICLFIGYNENNTKQLIFTLQGIELERKFYEYLKENNVVLNDFVEDIDSARSISIKEVEYIVIFYYNKRVVTGSLVRTYNDLINKSGKKVLLITNQVLNENALEKVTLIKESLSIIHHKNEDDLIKKLDVLLVNESV